MSQSGDPFGWVGATIDGKYQVEEFIAEGGFGAVYRGFHLGFQIPIAIKCIKLLPGLDDAQRNKLVGNLRGEGRLLHALSGETAGIVKVLDIGEATSPRGAWTPYITMEWLDGRTLEAEIEDRRKAGREKRGIEEAYDLLTPAAEALAIAHKKNVSHRDIKPANLFLIQSPDGVRMKVLDFGIAKVISQAPTNSSTLSAFTPFYGTPEQFSAGHGRTGLATDVFAMALTVLEVASGRRVLEGKGFLDIYKSARDAHRRPGLLRNVAQENGPVAKALRRALAPEPADRQRNLGELWAELESAITSTGDSRRTPMPPLPPSLRGGERGEHRVCTVMIVHITNLDALEARLDPEEVTEVMDRCLAAVTDQAKRVGATVQRSATDSAFVVFGAQVAMDRHAERAVGAALRGTAALDRVVLPNAARPVSICAMIAINTGKVFVRIDRQAGLTVIGEPKSAAQHLLKAAPPGSIVIGRDTYQSIASQFNVEPLAPVPLPDHAEPLLCYRVKGTIALKAPFASTDFHGIKTKLVGRNVEQQQIRAALEAMLSERRAELVTLIGPPGVGRSRLLSDFFCHLGMSKEPVLVLTGRCSPLFAETPYSLTAALLRHRLGVDERDLPRQIQQKLRVGMRWFRARSTGGRRPADEAFPLLAPPEEPPERAALDAALNQTAWILGRAETEVQIDRGWLDEPRTQMKQRSTAAVLLLARYFTRWGPIVLLCDDLQWADDASLDLIEALIQRGENLPVLVVGSAHPELLDRRPDWGKSAEANHTVRLGRLRPRAMEELIHDLLRQLPDLSTELIHMLAERAEGNPLILKETLDFLVDTGVIEVRVEGPWTFHARPGALRLPPTIQGIVQERLDRLEPEAREVLVLSAVVGRSFLHGAVDHLRRTELEGSSGRPTEAIFQQLRDRGLISAGALRTIPGEQESMFVEAATYEVAYQTQGVFVRRARHHLVAQWLEQRANNIPAGAALLAHHYDEAGDAREAAAAYVRAAAYATSVGDDTAALRHLERARVVAGAEQEDGKACTK